MFDCHAHLADSRFDEDLPEVLSRATEAGVESIICVSEHLEDAAQVLTLAEAHPMILPALGLYPEFADREAAEAMVALIRTHREKLVAIGEVGLDFWLAKEEPERALQRELLQTFAALSNELDLPLNIHSRSAGHYTIALLREAGARKVLMHAFDGRASYALKGVEAGFYFSIPPSIARSPQKQKLVRRLPLESLLLETDSPVLGPDRTQRNEPANARISAEHIAVIKEVSVEHVIAVTRENTLRLFGDAVQRIST